MSAIPIGYYAASALINFAAASLMAFVVILKNSRLTSNRTLALFSASVAWWSLFYYLWLQATDAGQAEFLMRTCMLGVVFMPSLWLHFVYSLLGVKGKGAVCLINYSVSAMFAVMVYTPLYATGVSSFLVFPYWLEPGPMFHIFLAYFVAVIVYGVILNYIGFTKSAGVKRTQLLYVFIGSMLAYPAGSSNYLMWYRVAFPPIFNIFVSVYVLMLGYAMVRHRLLDVRTAIARSVVYSLTLLAVAGFFAIATEYVSRYYLGLVEVRIVYIAMAVFLMLGFQPLRKVLDTLADRVLATGLYDFDNLVARIGNFVTTSLGQEELSRKVAGELESQMCLSFAAIGYIDEGFDLNKTWDSNGVSLPDGTTTKIMAAIDPTKTIITEELEPDSKQKTILGDLGIEILVPLRADNEVSGFMAFGPKTSGNMFTVRDLRLFELIAPEMAIGVSHAKLFEQRELRIKELDGLSRLALSLGTTLDLDGILELILDVAIESTKAENGSIMLIDGDGKSMSIKASRGIDEIILAESTVNVGDGVAGWVVGTCEPIIIVDGGHDNPYLEKCLKQEAITSSLTVPLRVKEKVIGILSVNRKINKEIFTNENLGLVNSFAAHAAGAIENAKLYDNLESTFLGTITALAEAIDARDNYTFGHSQEVTTYAVAVAGELGLSEDEIRTIEIASRLHDIGKIGIDDSILNKPDKLTEAEMEKIKQHPRIAVDILRSVDMLADTIPLILHHHERFDGNGYPSGIKGEQIPMGARIISVADSFNAMISKRPYARSKSQQEAKEELLHCSGTQFDEAVVRAFIRVLNTSDSHPAETKYDEAAV